MSSKEEPRMGIHKLKTTKGKEHKFIVSPGCWVCEAKDNKGNYIRKEIDQYLVTHSPQQTSTWLKNEYGIKIGKDRIATHLRKHSAFINGIKDMVVKHAETLALKNIDDITDTYVDAEEVIQEVITRGARKIATGEIEVDAKLLTAMIKEEGGRKKMGTLREMMEQLDRQRFKVQEGEIVPEATT